MIAAALALVWSNVVLPGLGLDRRRRTIVNAAFATLFAARYRRRVPVVTSRSVGFGAAAVAVPLAGYAVALAAPGTRAAMALRAEDLSDRDLLNWIAVDIPLGTVYSEELIFRGVLTPLLGPVRSAAIFGLWHVRPALGAGDNVVATVAVTACAGVVFDWLAGRGGLVAPALAHLSINSGGAVAAHLARRM